MTGATAKTFIGAGSTFNCTLNQGGAGALTITGSNTFSNITNTRKSTSAASILFTAGTTNTFTDWNASGESTRLLTIGSDTAANHTLSDASGTVSADFLSISRSTATGGADWYAGANSTDGGNNSGWIFTAPPSGLVLSGNVITGAVGTLLADRSIEEDGIIATGNVGTVDISRTVAITGNESTLSVQSVLVSPILTGSSLTGAVGTMMPETILFVAITGIDGTGLVGSVTNGISIEIIGVEASGSVGTMIGFGWGAIPDTAETWTAETDTPETWTAIADNSETWTQVPA
jgi:hypothetical protein